MALSVEDLRVILTVDADTSKMERSLASALAGVGGSTAGSGGGGVDVRNFFGKLLGGGGRAKVLGAALGGAGGLGQMGSLVGEALGGPEGAEIGAAVAKAIPGVVAKPVEALVAPLNVLATALEGMRGPLGPIGAGLNLWSKALDGIAAGVKSIPLVGEVLGPMFDTLAQVPKIIGQVLETLVSFSEKASPSQFKQFQVAVEDVQAVIGDAFLPVLELMRDAVRGIGDVLASILPNASEVRDALSGLRESLGQMWDALRSVMAELGPIIRQFLIANLKILAAALSETARLVRLFADAVNVLAAPLRALLGLPAEARTSMGAAARPADITGIDEYQRRLQLAAYAVPGGPTDKEQLPSNVADIKELVNRIYLYWTNEFTIGKVFAAVRDAMEGHMDPHRVAETVSEGAKAASFISPAAGAVGIGIDLGIQIADWLSKKR
jgi:hypothetical protein